MWFNKILKFALLVVLLCVVTQANAATCTLNHISLPVSSSGASPTSFTITSTVGDLIIVGIVINTAGAVTAVAGTVHSTTFTQRAAQTSAAGKGNIYLYDLTGAASGETTIKVTHSSTGLSIVAYDVTTPSATFDTKATAAQTTNASNPSIGTAANATPCIAVSVLGSGNGASAVASPFTIDNMDSAHISNAANAAHNVNGAVGTQTSTFTDATDQWCIGIATWKFTAASGCAPNRLLMGVGC